LPIIFEVRNELYYVLALQAALCPLFLGTFHTVGSCYKIWAVFLQFNFVRKRELQKRFEVLNWRREASLRFADILACPCQRGINFVNPFERSDIWLEGTKTFL
jgi:hypothetical protein